MEFLQLEYFLESALNENFSKTAANHLVPPSSVSASIKKLEKELGCQLFKRSANKISLNEEGKTFFNSAYTAMNLLNEAVQKLSNTNKDKEGTQKISLLIRSERSFINEKLLKFRKLYPNVSFNLTHSYLPLDNNNYDIIIDVLSAEYKEFISKPIISEKIQIAASVKNPIAHKKILLKDLKNQQFITLSEGNSLNRITKDTCKKAGFNPDIIIETDDPLYVRNYIKENFGIGFYPEKSWKDDTNKEIIFLDIVDFNYTRTTYVYLNGKKETPILAKKLFDFISMATVK